MPLGMTPVNYIKIIALLGYLSKAFSDISSGES